SHLRSDRHLRLARHSPCNLRRFATTRSAYAGCLACVAGQKAELSVASRRGDPNSFPAPRRIARRPEPISLARTAAAYFRRTLSLSTQPRPRSPRNSPEKRHRVSREGRFRSRCVEENLALQANRRAEARLG